MKTKHKIIFVGAAIFFAAFHHMPSLKACADFFGAIANSLILLAAIEYLLSYRQVTVKAPIKFSKKDGDGGKKIDDESSPLEWGVMKVRVRDLNASNLTNLFSTEFFGGGFMPGATRQAIVKLTNPDAFEVERVSE